MRNSLRALALLAGLSLSASAAQAPLRLNYQGKLLDASNVPRSGAVSMEFRILDAASGGNVLWGPETNSPTLVNGVFSVLLGGSVALTPDLFANGAVYLSVTAAPDVYPGGEMSPRQQLAMAPYSITANQLASATSVRVNSGVYYSTFSTTGNLLIPGGVVATTGTFTSVTAASGTFTTTTLAAITASSNIVVNGGAVDVNGPGGIDVLYGVIAGTINVRSPANVTSVVTSSNIVMNGGFMDVNAPIDATGRIRTNTMFSGFGSDIVGASPQVAQSSGSTNTALVANTETVVISTGITPLQNDRTIVILGWIEMVRGQNTTPLVVIRVRRAIGGACGTGSTLVYAYSMTRENNNPNSLPYPVMAVDKPNTTSAVEYCLTVNNPSTDSYRTRSLVLISGAP